MAKDDDILQEARERFAEAEDAWSELKTQAEDDLRFGRLGEQWPKDIASQRQTAARPCMTINKMPSNIRQVVNDGRQNRPSIKARPADSGADVATAEVMSGLIRHIESISDADVAYDTALDNAASAGLGFIEVDVDYATDDSFDLEIKINAVPNPLAVLWDAHTEKFDSSDWNYAFLAEAVPKKEFEAEYPDAESEWSGNDKDIQPWFAENSVRVCKYWSRDAKRRKIILLSDGTVISEEDYIRDKDVFDAANITFVRERESKSYEIVRRIITGCDVLDEKRWRGSIIPLVPVYGDAFNIAGKRYSNSLIHDAKDAQRIFNYSRSTATEMVSLSSKAPFIGRKGAFQTDAEKWASINTASWPYIEFDGQERPMREPFAGVPTGAINEAMMAADDIKQIIGIHDAGMGIPGNEISGKAIRYRQHEGDVSTFHFTDNQHRAIRCVGRVVVELIPQIYTGKRIIRVLGLDGKAQSVALGQPVQLPDGATRIYDLGAGKYDLAVEAGPSYTTRREESSEMLADYIRAAPQAGPILGPMMVKMADMPDGEKVSAMLATVMPPEARAIFEGKPPPEPGPPPELLAKQAEMQAEMQLETQKAQQQYQLAEQTQRNNIQIEQLQAQADIAVMRDKAQAELQIARERFALEMQLKREEAQLSASLKIAGAQQAATQSAAEITQ